jgi:hypothetical protein
MGHKLSPEYAVEPIWWEEFSNNWVLAEEDAEIQEAKVYPTPNFESYSERVEGNDASFWNV